MAQCYDKQLALLIELANHRGWGYGVGGGQPAVHSDGVVVGDCRGRVAFGERRL
jgi:hypothetical protein